MKYTTIRIVGSILSPDILDKIEQGDLGGQLPKDFGFDPKTKVRDEIARTWADAQDLWRIFKRQKERVPETEYGTTETRRYWIIPLLGLLGYDTQVEKKAEEVNGKSYAVSHRAVNLDQFPVHIVGFNDSLDKKRDQGGTRMSPHALLQEYVNLTEHLFAIVTNGNYLRLLRDSSRLVKLSFIEFDLETMMDEEHYADFALMFRLVHVSRMPQKIDSGAESLIEKYHQDALDSGSRIREGLSEAVEKSILAFANGFLQHPDNNELRDWIETKKTTASEYYQYQLRIIYRLLFLMVIEERNLIFTGGAEKKKRDIYYEYYSVDRLRKLCEKQYLADQRYNDLWISLKNTFSIFESETKSIHLGIKPLAGDLFSYNAIDILNRCNLDNSVILNCLKNLSVFINKNTGQKMRVNYASLNVEEFGSVYEGLLEYDPVIERQNGYFRFDFVKGAGRSASGSHYTPDELVQPLIKHSLDYVIKEKVASGKDKAEKEKNLLSIKVCDVACGSGHILLNAARRIATELAYIRTGEEQPSPSSFRKAVRDVIRECIYGVDLNPLAVELCKVALWLEAHNPGQPLNFLDHHIKCGNAIVGFARHEEVERGVPDEAFATLPGDDKDIASVLRKRNKAERFNKKQKSLEFSPEVKRHLDAILSRWHDIAILPERSPEEIEQKRKRYLEFIKGDDPLFMEQIAAIPIAQFYLPKLPDKIEKFITDAEFRRFWFGEKHLQGQATAAAWAMAWSQRFFHWFLEFPDIISDGGFDCILGNPPYLGGQALSGTYGHPFCNYVKWEYAPAGLSDLVVYFIRRIYNLIKPNRFTAFITTNSIKDGDIRKDGLEQILADGGSINFAVRAIKWPGRANLFVSLVSIHKGEWNGKRMLDKKDVPVINAFFEDSPDSGDPKSLHENADRIYQGSIFLGDGFLLSHEEAENLIEADPRNQDVIFPVINGQEVNSDPYQKPGRSIINFFDWEMDKAEKYEMPFRIVVEKVMPERMNQKDKGGKEYWWRFLRPRIELYNLIKPLSRCFVAAATTKYLNFSALPNSYVFTHALYVFTTDRWDLYSIVQSTIHEVWARKYSGALKQDLRYSPSDCFNTFPFPKGIWKTPDPKLAAIGEKYHEYRKSIMHNLQLGLTNIYNLFHARDLDLELVIKTSKRNQSEAEAGLQGILELRRLHCELDRAIRDAYGWTDIDLDHDFIEVETLPENDRVRYTIKPEARKEILKRLLLLNHKIHEQEKNKIKQNEMKKNKKTHRKPDDPKQLKIF